MDSTRQQATIAVSLILLFALALLVAMFRLSPQEVMGIAGIFSAWITAIVAFFFVERGAQNTVRTTTENVAKPVKAKEEEIAAQGSFFAAELHRQLEGV